MNGASFNSETLTIGECAQLACILEVTAAKAGNVTRFTDFDDLTYLDFVLSAMAIGPVMEQASEIGVGLAVREGVAATRRFVASNSNLGMLLLLAPLSAAAHDGDIREGVVSALDRLSVIDSRHVFEAIRLASPGGLGEAPEQDVRDEPTLPLRKIMTMAADRDLIARQYANGFRDVFEYIDTLAAEPLEEAIIRCHLRMLAYLGDTHIARRCGAAIAEEAKQRAGEVLALGWPGKAEGRDAFANFDQWLRADGHRRNPGSTADLVAACLFVALRRGMIALPLRFRPLIPRPTP
jgi:triphosphoribosyl-dephospho-CoA synthase